VQDRGDVCGACGVDFAKYGMMQLAQVKIESARESARRQKQSTVLREIVLAVLTGGFSLLKYLRPRR
jgi:hypothetical protein